MAKHLSHAEAMLKISRRLKVTEGAIKGTLGKSLKMLELLMHGQQ